MGAARTAPQALLGGTEKLLDDVAGAVHHLQHAVRLVAGHVMAGESVAVAVRIGEHDPLRLEAVPRAEGHWLELLAKVVVIGLDVGGDVGRTASGIVGTASR